MLGQLHPDLIQEWLEAAATEIPRGEPLQRLPKVGSEAFAFAVVTPEQEFTLGRSRLRFPLMSAIKPFLLLYALTLWQEQVWTWVGQRPSDYPYNSVLQLTLDQGWPRNPMINSGAIALAGQLAYVGGATAFQTWLNECAGTQFEVDQEVLGAVHRHPNWQNRTLAHFLVESGRIADAEVALEIYNQVCCFQGTVEEVARLGLLLALPQAKVSDRHRQQVNVLMLTCGLYEDSPRYGLEIGLPMKSGVSGVMLAIVPRQGAIACYSPPLDKSGNSILGLYLLQRISRHLGLSPLG
ncbi:glutaminase [Thermosynechococcus vestitus]|uniref:glutaminase n=1 Tax=Thermosynechococcus vestitus (strain NIES-2133 / IAM M-273 / BP-1) TaxID=197221 RepID=Q8DL98_THEVB|nr:glutaminase [Thermosynechococcus vestitus]BAC08150.1 tlr0598 [Thermosynechococcus vestitus BP-1]BAY51548.1 putative glutaminase [Thermostichus vulcanus NIES-2134]